MKRQDRHHVRRDTAAAFLATLKGTLTDPFAPFDPNAVKHGPHSALRYEREWREWLTRSYTGATGTEIEEMLSWLQFNGHMNSINPVVDFVSQPRVHMKGITFNNVSPGRYLRRWEMEMDPHTRP